MDYFIGFINFVKLSSLKCRYYNKVMISLRNCSFHGAGGSGPFCIEESLTTTLSCLVSYQQDNSL